MSKITKFINQNSILEMQTDPTRWTTFRIVTEDKEILLGAETLDDTLKRLRQLKQTLTVKHDPGKSIWEMGLSENLYWLYIFSTHTKKVHFSVQNQHAEFVFEELVNVSDLIQW